MKKKIEPEEQELEILKAVAQAWHGHSGKTRPTNEFDAYKRNFNSKPTRFKVEATNKFSKEGVGSNWDFGKSLWDSYEIVTMSKRLESGLVLDHPMPGSDESIWLGNAPPQSMEIFNAIEDMVKQIKSAGYVPNTAEARLDADEDEKEASVSHHSEKLVIAFGLIRTSPETTIRISKNPRCIHIPILSRTVSALESQCHI
ncbi:hypothetical protein HHK36_015659 [Tetracentron sinense]|uniref:DYW domain-containing protein n=1 Tax=Tetracentron sinense TaxID=13715 RepID=A0A834Z1E3_TETSI|nr:hypothetical protein HHK36_015659 [Tetracentron sinense]